MATKLHFPARLPQEWCAVDKQTNGRRDEDRRITSHSFRLQGATKIKGAYQRGSFILGWRGLSTMTTVVWLIYIVLSATGPQNFKTSKTTKTPPEDQCGKCMQTCSFWTWQKQRTYRSGVHTVFFSLAGHCSCTVSFCVRRFLLSRAL